MLVFALVASVAAGAGVALGLTADHIRAAVSGDLARFGAFAAAAVVLQLVSARVRGSGTVSASVVALVGAAVVLGAGPAMALGVVAAVTQWLRRRGLAHRALFDAANFALSAGAAGGVFAGLTSGDSSPAVVVAAVAAAALAYTVVNHGLLCVAMGVSEARSPFRVWHERFSWSSLCPPVLLALAMRSALHRAAVAN